MPNASMKFGYGNKENISTAIENGTIDEKDLVLTKDTSELFYVKDDKTTQVVRPRLRCFESLDEAVTEVNKSADTYAGQPVSVKSAVDGKYYTYMVQQGSSAFTVEPVVTTVSGGMTWTEF